MAQTFSTIISIVPEDKLIHFYQAVGNDKNSLRLDTKTYRGRQFDEEFFAELTKSLQDYGQANPSYSGKAAKVTIVLPNNLVVCDSVNVPGSSRKATSNMASTAVDARYRNAADLKINRYVTATNKQYSTVSLVVVRQRLIQNLYTSCATSNMFANTVTFAGNSTVNGAMALNGRLKGGNFVLLDVKETRTGISFVAKGNTLGCYNLPFGYSILQQNKVIAENMLFEHTVAELAVLNAKEKAKAKALTMMAAEESTAAEGDISVLTGGDAPQPTSDEESAFSAPEATRAAPQPQIKTLPKKQPRVLPKFMQRPVPETEQGIAYENFRYFVKWVLEFVRGNSRLTAIAQPEMVFVNMPADFDFLYGMVNAEKEENKIEFATLGLDKERDIIRDNLELYGALFCAQYNVNNNF